MIGLLVVMPFMSNTYSPLSSVFDDIIGAPGLDSSPTPQNIVEFRVMGTFCYLNGSFPMNEDIRIFATDDLISENLQTNTNGQFFSTYYFSDGQVLTISILEQRFEAFIPYFVYDNMLWQDTEFVNLGTFTIE